MEDSYPMSWKDLYLQTLLEPDEEKLTELVRAHDSARDIEGRLAKQRKPKQNTQMASDRLWLMDKKRILAAAKTELLRHSDGSSAG